VKHFPYSLLVAASLWLAPLPVLAADLQSWRFDSQQNMLEFNTDVDVQPRAQLIPDPTRLVIDLPGLKLGRPSYTQPIPNGGVIRAIRFGQFDPQTMRIVVELAPGYTLDPNQVKFRGLSPRRWTVQLPSPQPVAVNPTPGGNPFPGSTAPGNGGQPSTIIEDGTSGGSTTPPRVTLPPVGNSQLATIQSVNLEGNGDRLVIRADRTLQYTTGWDRATAAYRVTINSAKLADNLDGPRLSQNGPIMQLRLRQETPQTVAIYMQPASGVQINDVPQGDRRQIALNLSQSSPVLNPPTTPPTTTPPTITPPPTNIPVPEAPRPTEPEFSLPPVQNGKVVVVVDPGHGGRDPGAIGIGGLREKDVVIDISRRVAENLSRAGLQVVMTRQNDVEIGLDARVKLAQRMNATLFVSIHANAMPAGRSDVNGLETYYYSSGLGLARSIHKAILESIRLPDRGVRKARFYVLRNTSMPSVLVETGFVSGNSDSRRLADPNYRKQMADAISEGVLQYLRTSGRR